MGKEKEGGGGEVVILEYVLCMLFIDHEYKNCICYVCHDKWALIRGKNHNVSINMSKVHNYVH